MKLISTFGILRLLSIVLPCYGAALPASVNILQPAQSKRAAEVSSSIIPQTNVSLHYASLNATADADVAAAMKLPSVLLERIASITQVDCSANSVSVVFSDITAFETGSSTWPSSDFLLFTNHLGDCDAENERGVYLVKSIVFSNDTLSVTASTSKTSLAEQAKDVSITFSSATSPAKRDLSATVSAEISEQTLISSKYLTIVTDDSSVSSTVTLSGGLSYNFEKFALEEFYVDIDLSANLDLGVTANVSASYSTDVYSYNPGTFSVSAFSIPGVLDLGPYLEFQVGIEFAAAGSVEAAVDFTSTLSDGKVHLDFVNSSLTSTSGWTPTHEVATNVSAEVELQLNPYVTLTLGLGANLFSGLIDLSAGVEAKPMIVNAFVVDAEFDYTSQSGVVFTQPTNDTCVNGAWFASTFSFEVDAFVTSLYNVQLYQVKVPIYESECWSWVG